MFRILGVVFMFIVHSQCVNAQINCPPHLPLTLLGNTSYCIGSPGSALSIEESYVGYEWLPTTETNQSVLLTAGSYQVVVTHYTGCTDTLDFVVEQASNPPQPTIDVSGPTQFCEGGSVTLTVPTWYPYYEWSTGSVSDEITVFESGTFVVSITDWIGCSSSSNSIQVIVDPLPVAAFSPFLNMYDIEFTNLSEYATSYEWNFGDGSFSSDFEPNHTYSSTGLQEMWMVASNDCGSDTAFYDLSSVGVSELDHLGALEIYPNPSEGSIKLSLEMKYDSPISITLLDGSGKALMQSQRSLSAGQNQLTFDLSSFPNGLYFLSLNTEYGFISKKLILK